LAGNRRRLVSGLLLLFFTLAVLFPAPAVHAQGGIALAGTFHLQEYTLPQGTEISHPSIHLVVFNHGDELMVVRMEINAPFGVEVLLEETEFTLEPRSDRKLFITVRITEDAVPGEYDLIITATSAPAGEVDGTGARLATASAQKATLVVTGAAARVKARVVTPDGLPIEAQLRLFKILAEKLNDISQTETGEMDVKVSPGMYRVVAYIAGRRLAEEEFEILADEVREIELIVRTAYFEQFGIEANYIPDTDQLSFVRMVYTLNNLAGPLDNVEVILRVTLDGQPLEDLSLIILGRLDLGRTGGSASYVPEAGWQPGEYTFWLDLNVEEEFYIESDKQTLSLAPVELVPPIITTIIREPFGPAVPAFAGVSLVWWVLVLIIIIVIIVIIWLRRRRKEVPEKPVEEAPPPEEEEVAEAPEEEELPQEEAIKVTDEGTPPLLEEQVEAEEVPEGEIEEPPDAEWEEEAEDVPEGEIEEPPEAEVKEEPTTEAPEEPSEEEDKPADQ